MSKEQIVVIILTEKKTFRGGRFRNWAAGDFGA